MFRFITSILALLLLAATADAQRDALSAPDGASRLISKDVGGERWAISVDEEDGTIVGNVFRPDGGAPQLVWCWPQSTSDDPVRLRCAGTTGCEPWTDLGEVELPGSFLAPASSCDAGAALASPTVSAATTSDDSGSVLRLSPDERRVLISKDVAGLRWAVAYDPARIITATEQRPARIAGNVFDPAGGAAQFVFCSIRDVDASSFHLGCSAATGCGASTWSDLGDVTLPRTFLEQRRCPSDTPRPGRVATLLPSDAGDAGAFGPSSSIAGALAAVAVPNALYVYEQGPSGWQQSARLVPPNGPYFGRGVAVAGGTIAVGHDHRARLYEKVDGVWSLSETLSPSRIDTSTVAAMDQQTLVLLSTDDQQRHVVVSYARGGDGWHELQPIVAPPSSVETGIFAAAVSGDTLAATVMAPRDPDASPPFVQLYRRQGDGWEPTVRLAPERATGVSFGRSLALEGDTLVVGVPPDSSRERRASDGEALVFARQGDAWNQVATLHTCAADAGRFAGAVALAGDVIVVGATDWGNGDAAGDLYRFTRTASGWQESGRLTFADVAPSSGAPHLSGTTVLAPTPGAAVVLDVASPDIPPPTQCPAPPAQQWPAPDWQSEDPTAHDMNPVLLERARAYAFQDGAHTQGLVVVRHGVIVGEWYEPGRDADSFAGSWSSGKSIAGAVIGIAIDRGAVPGVEVGLAQYYPQWAHTANAAITLRDALSMSSGLDWSESYAVDSSNVSDIARLASAERDELGYVLTKPLAYPPGTFFSYSSADSMMLSGVIEGALGKTLGAYAREVLFDPIGMTRAEWWSDAVGHTLSYCCVDAPSREFARFGLLFARGGRWGDAQVVSSGWVRASTSPTATRGDGGSVQTNGYGYQWWLGLAGAGRYTADGFEAIGWDGQFIWVFPSLDLVIVRNGHYDKDPGPPVADPSLFAHYPSAGLGNGRGTIPPAPGWDESELLRRILDSIIAR